MLERTWKGVALAALLITPVALPSVATARVNDSTFVVSGDYRGESRSVTISMADLNLRQDPGARTARTRIRHAAEKVCDKDSVRRLYQKLDYARCYDPAITSAQADLDTLVGRTRAG